MGLYFTNYSEKGEVNGAVAVQKKLLDGASASTVVKSLQVITGNESCYLKIIRKRKQGNAGSNYNTYATINLEMKANDYLLLWQGFFVIPYGDRLCFQTDSNYCTVIANVIEMT